MRTLSNSIIRDCYGLKKTVPIYHTDYKVSIDISQENIENIGGKTIYELAESRPFDEMVISVWATTITELSVHPDDFNYYFTVHLRPDGLISSYCFYEDGTEIKYDFIENKEGSKWLFLMLSNIIGIFSYKQSKIYLGESIVKVPSEKTGKLKRKKEKVLYITKPQYVKDYRGTMAFENSYESHLVSGHWRTLGPEQTGKDRSNKRVVQGKTWVRPYKTGQGKEVFETIRKWR
jgi:hypothetical protein